MSIKGLTRNSRPPSGGEGGIQQSQSLKSCFNKDKQFTIAFAELYQDNLLSLDQLSNSFFEPELRKHSELSGSSETSDRDCIDVARDIRICQVAIDAQGRYIAYLESRGATKRIEEARQALEEAMSLLDQLQNTTAFKPIFIDRDKFILLKKQAESEAETFMTQRCANLRNSPLNENGVFTDAYVGLYRNTSIELGRLTHLFFEQEFLKHSTEILKSNSQDPENKVRIYTNVMRDILICQTAVNAERKYLDTTLFGIVKNFFEKIGQLFGVETSLEKATKILNQYETMFSSLPAPVNDKKNYSDRIFDIIWQNSPLTGEAFLTMKKQAEFEAEVTIARQCAVIRNATFQYEVGDQNKRKTVFVEPNGDCCATSEEADSKSNEPQKYLILLNPDGDVYKINVDNRLGVGTTSVACPARFGSKKYPEFHDKKFCVTISNNRETSIEKIFESGKIIAKVHENGENSHVIQQYEIFTQSFVYSNGKEIIFSRDKASHKDKAAVHVQELGSVSLTRFLEDMGGSLLEYTESKNKEFFNSIKADLNAFSVKLTMELNTFYPGWIVKLQNIKTDPNSDGIQQFSEEFLGWIESIYEECKDEKCFMLEFRKRLYSLCSESKDINQDDKDRLDFINSVKDCFKNHLDGIEAGCVSEFINQSKLDLKEINPNDYPAVATLLQQKSVSKLLNSNYVENADEIKKEFNDFVKPYRIEFIISLIKAVAGLHNNGIIHRDLKPDNILIVFDEKTKEIKLKLIDFGDAVSAADNDERVMERRKETRGTPAYFAPELFPLDSIEATINNDIWSLGIILFEILFGFRPFKWQREKMSAYACCRAIVKQKQEEIDDLFKDLEAKGDIKPEDQPIAQMIKSMLIIKPKERSSAKELQEKCEALQFDLKRSANDKHAIDGASDADDENPISFSDDSVDDYDSE